MGKITGTKGFQMILQGSLPPEVEALGDDAASGWIAGQISIASTLLAYLQKQAVTVVPMVQLTGTGPPTPLSGGN